MKRGWNPRIQVCVENIVPLVPNMLHLLHKILIYIIYICSNCYCSKNTKVLPAHVRPSPMYPCLQLQLKDPAVFAQLAFTSQTWPPFVHSSVSENVQREQKLERIFFCFITKTIK